MVSARDFRVVNAFRELRVRGRPGDKANRVKNPKSEI
jgi:hypothetical protein